MRLINIEDKDKLWFISDPHFYHENIIKYCNRPFASIDEMNQTLIENWNGLIQPGDTVIIGGDLAFSSNIEKITELVYSLHGKKYLAFGNHDYQNKLDRQVIKDLFHDTGDLLYLMVDDEEIDGKQSILVSHYPMLLWPNSWKGAWQVYGHVHSGPYSSSIEAPLMVHTSVTQYDIGVDNNDFCPISYEDLKVAITRQYLTGKASVKFTKKH